MASYLSITIYSVVILASSTTVNSELRQSVSEGGSQPKEYWIDPDVWRDFTIFEIILEFQRQYPDIVDDSLQVLREELNFRELWKEEDEFQEEDFALKSSEVELFGPFENVTWSEVTPCSVCTLVAAGLKLAAITDVGSRLLIDTLYGLCLNVTDLIDIRGDPLCDVLKLQLPHVLEVLRPLNAISAETMCTHLNACFRNRSSTITTFTDLHRLTPAKFGLRGKIPSLLPVKDVSVKRVRDLVTGLLLPPEGSIVVAQITDVHIEPEYKANTNTNCGLPVCCVERWGPGSAGILGDYNCNIPRSTMEIFLSKVKLLNPDIILFSGDVPPHSVWDETEQSQRECSETLVESIKNILPSHNVYPNVGNHETYPTNLFSWYDMLGDRTKSFTEWYANLWKNVSDFTLAEMNTVSQGGYYSKLISDRLRLVSLNTNYMYSFNWYNPLNHRGRTLPPARPSEYQRMISFVQTELVTARNNREKVILMSHHPPGGADYLIAGSQWYRQLVLNFSDVIVLQTSGHTHLDEFRMIYDDLGTPQSVMFVLPSMSAGGTRNPSMRVYYLHNETKELIDYDHYFMNLRPALYKTVTENNETDLITLLYSARDEYNLNDMLPASWHDLLIRFERDQSLVSRHRELSHAEGLRQGLCTGRCSRKHICRQRHVNFDEYRYCVRPQLPTVPPRPTAATKPPPSGVARFGIWSKFGVSFCTMLLLVQKLI